MSRIRRPHIIIGGICVIGLAVFVTWLFSNLETVEREDIEPATSKVDLLADDNLKNKNPRFDPDLVDSRPFGDTPDNPWQINASAAVLGLDIPDIIDAYESPLLELRPSYAAAAKPLLERGIHILPSVNMLNGKAKQFDDGLYAELDVAMTAQKMDGFHDTSRMIREILAALDPAGAACAWIRGGLEIGGFPTPSAAPPAGGAATKRFIAEFDRNEVESKPVGFYTWSDELKRTFRFLRYLQKGWSDRKGVPDEIAAVLAARPDLLSQYKRMLDFYAHLSNPLDALTFADLADPDNAAKDLNGIWGTKGLAPSPLGPTVHLLPYSTSHEAVLFNRLFGASGLPEGADLMLELVRAIRNGRVDLQPKGTSGWYDYQIYALETFLLPERAKENEKLLLTKKYKQRMLEAFKAILTLRRETHVRQQHGPTGCAPGMPPSKGLRPRLRVEPNPTFYLRTARAYAFLQTYLEAALPKEIRGRLTGRREGGSRGMALADELEQMKNLFYGLHLTSCEEIGMRPMLLEGEPVNHEAYLVTATKWLDQWPGDPDLAVDTRVSVPIFVDPSPRRQKTALWCTLGVRAAKLKAWYAKPPKWRPMVENPMTSGWQEVDAWRTVPAEFVILVDEFAEATLQGLRTLTREELRAVCDHERTKEKIVCALER